VVLASSQEEVDRLAWGDSDAHVAS
jgi:hypothetical protein